MLQTCNIEENRRMGRRCVEEQLVKLYLTTSNVVIFFDYMVRSVQISNEYQEINLYSVTLNCRLKRPARKDSS